MTNETTTINETSREDFGVTDAKGRTIGARVRIRFLEAARAHAAEYLEGARKRAAKAAKR